MSTPKDVPEDWTKTMSEHGWRVGDRVSLCPTGRERDRVDATVTAIDEPGLSKGVRVHFDQLVRGLDNAYATHDELTLLRRVEDINDA